MTSVLGRFGEMLSRFPPAGMSILSSALGGLHRPGSMVFTPLWLEERERSVALHPLR